MMIPVKTREKLERKGVLEDAIRIKDSVLWVTEQARYMSPIGEVLAMGKHPVHIIQALSVWSNEADWRVHARRHGDDNPTGGDESGEYQKFLTYLVTNIERV